MQKKNKYLKLNDTNIIIKKSNDLISKSQCSLGINEQKILYKVTAQIRVSDKDFKDYKLRTEDIIKFIDTNSNTIYADIRQYTRNLVSTPLTIEENDRIIQTNWFVGAKHLKNGTILFSFHPSLKPHLLELKRCFTEFKLENIRNFRSKYSPKIYELLKQNEKIGYRKISIDELRKILMLEKSYKQYSELKRYILVVTQNEISKNTDITFEFTEIKEGKKVISLRFDIESKIDKENCIDLPIINREEKNQFSNNKVIKISKKIKGVINDEVDNRKILEWLEAEKENDIYFYLDNWNRWDYKEKKTKSGFFIDLIDNNRSLPLGEKGIRVSKPVQSTNYEQRQYDDKFFNSLYDNVDFTEDED